MQKPELFGLVVAARTGGTNGRSRAPDSCGGNAGAGGDWQHSVASPSGGVGAVGASAGRWRRRRPAGGIDAQPTVAPTTRGPRLHWDAAHGCTDGARLH